MSSYRKTLGFQYSLDGGSTWSTAVELECNTVRAYLKNEEVSNTRAANGYVQQILISRLALSIVVSATNFNPKTVAAAEANFTTMQKFYSCNGLKRVYNDVTTPWPTLDEFTEFNSDTNTNYVNVVSYDVEFEKADDTGSNSRKIRRIVLELECVNKYTVT